MLKNEINAEINLNNNNEIKEDTKDNDKDKNNNEKEQNIKEESKEPNGQEKENK